MGALQCWCGGRAGGCAGGRAPPAALDSWALVVEILCPQVRVSACLPARMAWVARTGSRQQRMIDQAVAVSTAAGQRSVDEAVAEVRRLEVAPVRQWLQAALAERDMWRQTAEDTAKAEEGARRLRGRLGASPAAARALPAAGPIVLD